MEIRPARTDEATVLAELQEAASVAALAHIFPPDEYPFPREVVLERWTVLLADDAASVLVAERDARLLGLAAVRPEWLDGLYVRPESWGSGVARRLHDDALSLLRARGCTVCHLPVGARAQRARPALLRAPRLGRERRHARGAVPAAAAGSRLHAPALTAA